MPVRYDQDTQDDHRKANRACIPLGCPALRRGRHVMVLTGADPDSAPASPRPADSAREADLRRCCA